MNKKFLVRWVFDVPAIIAFGFSRMKDENNKKKSNNLAFEQAFVFSSWLLSRYSVDCFGNKIRACKIQTEKISLYHF